MGANRHVSTYLKIKRAFDVSFGVMAIVLASPLMLLIVAAIRADSPGPALFRQERVTEGGSHVLHDQVPVHVPWRGGAA